MRRMPMGCFLGLGVLAGLLGAAGSAGAAGNEAIYRNLPALELPEVEADVLAFGESLRLIAVFGEAGYRVVDGPGDVLDLNLDAGLAFSRRMERERWGYSFTAELDTSLETGLTAADKTVAWSARLQASVLDLRYYLTEGRSAGRRPWEQAFVFVQAAADPLGFGIEYQSRDDRTEQWGQARAVLGAGFGVGRLLDIGPRLRLLKLERMLLDHGLLAGPIPKAVGDRILLTWFALRDALGSQEQLFYTFKLLHQAGLLQGEPSLSATYDFLAIFDDPQIDGRLLGRDLRFGMHAGYDHLRPAHSNHTSNLAFFEFAFSYTEIFQLGLDAWLRLSPAITFHLPQREDSGQAHWSGWDLELRLPARLTRHFYDAHYNSQGRLRIAPYLVYRPVDRFRPGAVDTIELGAEFNYDFAYHRGHYYSVGLSIDLFHADRSHESLIDIESNRFTVSLSFSYNWGHAAGAFTAHGPLQAELGWLSL
jgi:hypothetical protein